MNIGYVCVAQGGLTLMVIQSDIQVAISLTTVIKYNRETTNVN